jgi:RNA polymerase sigma-70 factor, ECF subfamily
MSALAAPFPLMDADFAPVDPLRALALAARDGENAAFTQLYERTYQLAWGVLYKVVGPSSELEDLLQESYLQLMKALKSYRGDAKVTTFLHRVCVNVGLMHLRTRRRRPEDPTEVLPAVEAGSESNPEHAAKVKQASVMMEKALTALSPEKAAVFTYHEILGLKPEEISELEGIPVNTVRSRLNRARIDFTEAVARLGAGAP